MKKNVIIILIVAMLFSVLTACGKDQNVDSNNTENETEKPVEVAEGEISAMGLGTKVSTMSSKDAKDGKAASAQSDVTIAAVAFDSDGKIVDIKLDVAQSKASFNEDNLGAQVEGIELKTKKELGDDYQMRGASAIEKEWFEQAEAFEKYAIGKTSDEIVTMPTKAIDDYNPNCPDVPELESSCTIDVGDFLIAVQKAWENSKEANGATELKLSIESNIDSKPAKDGKDAMIQIDTNMVCLALDSDGKIVASEFDTVQSKLSVTEEGIVEGKFDDVKTKKELGDDYQMRGASPIEKEWFEQVEAFENYSKNKTLDEIINMPTKALDDYHPTCPDVPELESSCTIDVGDFLSLLNKIK
ncbi:MAG: hypothetical protein Q4P29_02075 [Tissierellia bacterium]|nr:hypothetical protein [Tissierellia bacterium]